MASKWAKAFVENLGENFPKTKEELAELVTEVQKNAAEAYSHNGTHIGYVDFWGTYGDEDV